MPKWWELWGVSALPRRADRGGAEDHGVPLLPNQESSEENSTKADVELEGDDEGDGSWRGKNLMYDDLTRTALCGLHRISFVAIALILAVGVIVVVKLIYGRTSITGYDPSKEYITELTPAHFTGLGARRVRIKYGPYNVPQSSIDNGMANFVNKNSTKPCEDCLITYIQAGLEYPDGTRANADTGLWLHHVVQLDTATDDTVCGKSIIKRPLSPNRFFASGNERSSVSLCADGKEQTGYFLARESTLITSIELMNETPQNLTGVLTVEYEFIPAAPFPPEFQNLTSAWLDVGGCGSSDIPPKESEHFVLTMPTPWALRDDVLHSATGRIISAGGHLHDGGTHVEILRNNAPICDSTATYGAAPGYTDSQTGMQHISNMSFCGGGDALDPDDTVHTGDVFSLRAHYNMTAHTSMKEADGSVAPVMGIGLLYFVSNPSAG